MTLHKAILGRNTKVALFVIFATVFLRSNGYAQARQVYDDAAKAFLDAAAKTKCPERRAFFIKGANFNKCMANALGGKGTGNCGTSPDLNNVPPCPADSGENGGNQSSSTAGVVTPNQQNIEAMNQVGYAVGYAILGLMDAIDAKRTANSYKISNEAEKKKIDAKIQYLKDYNIQQREEMEKLSLFHGQYISCETCSGVGLLTCQECSGNGSSQCNTCNGSGKSDNTACWDCYGTGKETCYRCDGLGKTECYMCGSVGTRYIPQPDSLKTEAEKGNLYAKFLMRDAHPEWVQELLNKKYPAIFASEASKVDYDNKLKRVELLRKGSEQGDRFAMGLLAQQATFIANMYNPQDYSLLVELVNWAQKGVELKDANSIYYVKLMTIAFDRELADQTKGLKFKSEQTSFFLGVHYFYGIGTSRDLDAAEKWFSSVKKKSNFYGGEVYYPYAQLHLGMIAALGRPGTPIDKAKAKKYYEKALELGVKEASTFLSNL